ncbi:MAG: hypothetical protein ACR2JD_02890 [Nocardioides sp.]
MKISYPASRAMSAATAVYGVYALLRPAHLADAMRADAGQRGSYDTLAKAYGVRDLAISTVAILGPTAGVRAAMRSRIAGDLVDCATLAVRAGDGKVRAKVIAVTVGWAALNFAALRWDESSG